jgi:hypothetical protein
MYWNSTTILLQNCSLNAVNMTAIIIAANKQLVKKLHDGGTQTAC